MRASYDFSKAKPNPYAKRLKKQIGIRLDQQTIGYFRTLASEMGVPYQTLIILSLCRFRSSIGAAVCRTSSGHELVGQVLAARRGCRRFANCCAGGGRAAMRRLLISPSVRPRGHEADQIRCSGGPCF